MLRNIQFLSAGIREQEDTCTKKYCYNAIEFHNVISIKWLEGNVETKDCLLDSRILAIVNTQTT